MSQRLVLSGMLLILGCGGGVTIIDPPPPPPAGPTILHLIPETEDSAAARMLGWQNGIPDAVVTVTPVDSSAPPQVFHGTGAGTVDLSGLPAMSLYSIEARRWLSSDEKAQLSGNEDVIGWAMERKLASGSGEATVKVPASRKHGLVVSEWASILGAPPPVNQTYFYSGFLELYNNADSVVFLDGLVLALGLMHQFDAPTWTCASDALMTDDPAGIWVRWVNQFPGRGRDFPLEPGGVVVIATDAIDHSKIVEGGPDLSHADFEFWGSGDVDNPAVPNMVDTLSLGGTVVGHGADFNSPFVVLSKPFSPQGVPQQLGPAAKPYLRIPRELIMDVFTAWSPAQLPLPFCRVLVNSIFDRSSSSAWARGSSFRQSLSRRTVPTGDSRGYLQWTGDSNVDFILTTRSPEIFPGPSSGALPGTLRSARRHLRHVSTGSDSSGMSGSKSLLEVGYRVYWTDLRMTLDGMAEPATPDGAVVFSNWEI